MGGAGGMGGTSEMSGTRERGGTSDESEERDESVAGPHGRDCDADTSLNDFQIYALELNVLQPHFSI